MKFKNILLIINLISFSSNLIYASDPAEDKEKNERTYCGDWEKYAKLFEIRKIGYSQDQLNKAIGDATGFTSEINDIISGYCVKEIPKYQLIKQIPSPDSSCTRKKHYFNVYFNADNELEIYHENLGKKINLPKNIESSIVPPIWVTHHPKPHKIIGDPKTHYFEPVDYQAITVFDCILHSVRAIIFDKKVILCLQKKLYSNSNSHMHEFHKFDILRNPTHISLFDLLYNPNISRIDININDPLISLYALPFTEFYLIIKGQSKIYLFDTETEKIYFELGICEAKPEKFKLTISKDGKYIAVYFPNNHKEIMIYERYYDVDTTNI